MHDVDVAIVGGGPAGCTVALALGRAGISALVLDRSDDRPRVGETLPPAIARLLVDLGLWERFLAANHTPSFGTSARWGNPAAHENDFIASPYGQGWHVDRTRFDAMLAHGAEAAGAVFYRQARASSVVARSDHAWQVDVLRDGHSCRVRATIVVDATGRAATVGRNVGSRRLVHDRLIGVVGSFVPCTPSLPQRQVTQIEASQHGWWYSAPLPSSEVVVAYMTDGDLYARALRAAGDVWQKELRKTVGTRARVRQHALVSPPVPHPAFGSQLRPAAGSHWLAVGDAAAAYDPLSGQGIYKALDTGIRAARAIERCLGGDSAAMPEYRMSIERACEQYIAARTRYYAAEQRWPTSPFWVRRASGGPAEAAARARPAAVTSLDLR